MLFHVVATHQAQTCPVTLAAGEAGPEAYRNTVGRLTSKESADESKVTLHSALVNGPAHRIFLTVEAADQSSLARFLQPLKVIGDCDINPVTDLAAATL